MEPFGCPAYVLSEELQQGQPFNKWKQISRTGIYLGQSPIHVKDVALIINPATGYVSPQYHFRLDKRLKTAKTITTSNKWKTRTGFALEKPGKRKKDES